MVLEKDCKLGQLLYSEGMNKYSDLQEMNPLEVNHKELHQLTFQIMREKKSGEIEKARESLKELGDISTEIVSLLDKLELKIKYRDFNHPTLLGFVCID